jgi:hypothetical protein
MIGGPYAYGCGSCAIAHVAQRALMSSGVPELCSPRFRARFVAVCPQKSRDRLRIKNVTVQSAILTPEVVEVNFNGLSGETVSLDWKYLAVDSSVPSLHS